VIDVDGYEHAVVFGGDKHSLTARHCLKRPSDGFYAVGFVERIPYEGDHEKALDEIHTPLDQLNFTTEDASEWTWHPTLSEAVEASKETFSAFEHWAAKK
jgi:hypothetical protein